MQLVVYIGQFFTIEWYYTVEGKSPARDFFLGLSVEQKASFLALAKRIGDYGQIYNDTKFRNEGDKIYAFKPKPSRFLCFFYTGKKIIITNAFIKKTQKLPLQEKERAIRYSQDYQLRVQQKSYYEKFKKN